jgi:hypothetical protein
VFPIGPRRSLSEARAQLSAAWRRRRRLGESDCEEIGSGLLAQPVNALSSLAYVAGGSWVARRGAQSGRPAAMAFGGVLGAVGAGSVLYHGPCPPGAQQAHDASLAAAMGLVVLHNTTAMTGRHRRAPGLVHLGAAVVAALPVLPSGRYTNPVVALLGVSAFATEAQSVRYGIRARRPAAISAGTFALGALIHALSRTGGPLCRPHSRLQGHALWHVLSAVSLAAWARGALLPST